MKYYIFLLGLLLLSCNNTPLQTSVTTHVSDDVKQAKTVYVNYKQTIKGYRFYLKYELMDSEPLWGNLIIESPNKRIDTCAIHCYMSDFYFDTGIEWDSLQDNETITVDYYKIYNSIYTEKEDCFPNYIEDPFEHSKLFGFYDANFDGKDELFIRWNSWLGQKSRALYSFYTCSEMKPILEDHQIDSGWLFDKLNKRIISDLTCGIGCQTYSIWEWNENKDSLIHVKDMKEIGFPDSVHIATKHIFYKDTNIVLIDTVIVDLLKGSYFDQNILYHGLKNIKSNNSLSESTPKLSFVDRILQWFERLVDDITRE